MKESTDDKAVQELLLPDDDSSSDEHTGALEPHLVKIVKLD